MNPFDCHACDGQVDDHEDGCSYARSNPCPTCGQPKPKPKPTARPPHPATMIGRTNRAVCLLDADCIAGVDHDGECIQ